MYLNDTDLFYEIIISKGKGYLTEKAQKYFEMIAKNAIRKMNYKNVDELLDCMHSGILMMLENWYNFDENKYKKALPYFTEIYKRGIADGYNELHGKKSKQYKIKFISLESSNDGKGLHNII